ncbi:LapA family protein [Hydrogenovibrio kuenenii]|uniref:LapA family protein n=1 Tax=Hydrogenovibrio kuenenii TaxID=63658 RepID=UPI000466DA0F|nr:LapA family protein [Hydrogenovibrio kuenenii]
MKKIHSISSIIVIILVAIFALQNTSIVEVKLLFWGFSAQIALLVVILIGLGFILGVLFSGFSKHKEKDEANHSE